MNSEDSDQTGWMPRLIGGFAGRILILLVLSCREQGLFMPGKAGACLDYLQTQLKHST